MLQPTSNSSESWGTWPRALGIAGVVGVGSTLGYLYYKKKWAETKAVEELQLNPEELKTQGNALFKAFKYDEALLKFQRAIAVNTQDDKVKAACYQNCAAIYESKKDYQSCLDACNRALEIDEFYVKAMQRRARCYQNIGEIEKCLEDFLTASVVGNIAPPKEVTEIIATSAVSEFDARVQGGKARVPISPFVLKFWALYSVSRDPVLALMKNGSKDGEEAAFVECYEMIMRDEPNALLDCILPETTKTDSPFLFEAYLLAARLYNYHSDRANSLRYLNMCEELWENGLESGKQIDWEYHYVSMYLLKVMMSTDPAEQARLISLAKPIMEEDNADVYLVAGLAALDVNDIAKAKEMFERALEMDPDLICARAHSIFCQGFVAIEGRDMAGVNKAVLAMEDFAKENGASYPMVYVLAGRLYLLCENSTEAEKQFIEAKKHMPNCGMVHFMLALTSMRFDTVHWTEEALKSAADQFEAVIKVDPCYTAPFSILCKIQMHLHKYGDALKSATQALAVSSNQVEFHMMYIERTLLEYSMKIARRLRKPESEVVAKLISPR